MSEPNLLININDQVATITINRPKSMTLSFPVCR